MRTPTWIRLAAIGMLSGVALGAFGAHALKTRLPADLQAIFEVGVRYQLIHAVALLGIAWLNDRFPQKAVTQSGWLLVAGILIFSGSLYILALTGVRTWGAVTPIGGALFLAGWASLLRIRT